MTSLRGFALGGAAAPRRTAFLLAALALAGLYLVKTRWHRPRAMEAAEVEARIERLRAADDGPETREASAARASLAADLPLYERHLAEAETLIPVREDVSSILSALSAAERQAGVEMTLLRPAPPQPGEFYETWSYELGVRGEYGRIGAFLTAIASLPHLVATEGLVVAADALPATGSPAAGRGQAAAVSAVAAFTMRAYVRRADHNYPDAK